MYHSFINCKKFNYKNGIDKDIYISINKHQISYYNKSKKKDINMSDIIGFVYGPKTYTFKKVKKCKPWLTFSVILQDRTYDFQMNKYIDIILIRNFIKKHNPLCNLDNIKKINHNFRLMLNRDKDISLTYREWINNIQDSHNNLIPYNNECPICLDIIEKKDEFILQCRHNYHKNCILMVVDKKCPVCREIYI